MIANSSLDEAGGCVLRCDIHMMSYTNDHLFTA